AYPDSGGVPTIGWGHTGPDVHLGLSWTQQRADFALNVDLRVAADGVSKLISRPLAYGQMGALISLAFNVGSGAIKGTPLAADANAGVWMNAAKRFLDFAHVAGKEAKGLLWRRLVEAAAFLQASP